MKTACVILLSCFLLLTANATSFKTPQTVSVANVRALLEIYKTKHGGDFPKNWQEFIDSGILSGQVLTNSRRFLDLENRYIFVELKPMRFGNKTERILIMARQPGGEGDNHDAEDPEKRKGRWLIVETSDGSIQTRKYSEGMLKLWFEKAGLNLADFTSAAPPPPEYTRPLVPPDSENKPLGGPDNLSNASNGGTKNQSNHRKKDTFSDLKPNAKSSGLLPWVIWIAGGIVVIAILGWLVRNRST